MIQIPTWVSRKGLLEHIGMGALLTLILGYGAAPWAIFLAVLWGGIAHEWADGDLLSCPGHPWNGLLDILAFVVVPGLYWWAS